MKAIPGGDIPPDQIIGRDKLIDRLWEKLERQSLVLTAERRIGKTCVLKKMKANPPSNTLPCFGELEALHTPMEFVRKVYADVETCLSGITRGTYRVRDFLTKTKGLCIAGIVELPEIAAPDWKTILRMTVEDLLEHQTKRVVFFWDEFPYMLHNIAKRTGPESAMDVLDVLRELRQTHSTLRIVLTGSIGLQNVITGLQRSGYANDPLNDLDIRDVPPLVFADAHYLASLLLIGENIETEDREIVSKAIAEEVDCIPYYIHYVVDRMKDADELFTATVASVKDIVNGFLTGDQDPLHFEHYHQRIKDYYTPDERPFALGLLDILAMSDEPLAFDELFNRLQARLVTEDMEAARDVLKLLRRDHYLTLESDGRYRFRFSLIQRWWRLHRGGTR